MDKELHSSSNKLLAFVDESGQHDLEITKQGASNLFVCAAVFLEPRNFEAADATMRNIRREYFGGAEVKSSQVGGNHKRRLKLLNLIQDIEFGYFALVIDKSRIRKESGLKYKSSFYKFIYRMMYDQISSAGRELEIVADGIGGKDFVTGFPIYLDTHRDPLLFPTYEHRFANSDDVPLLQLADMIAGTLSYYFDPEKRCDSSNSFKDSLLSKELGVSGWPLDETMLESMPPTSDNDIDDKIHRAIITKALYFIKSHKSSLDPFERMQADILEHLLFLRQYFWDEASSYVYTRGLIEYLERLGYDKPSEQAFRMKVMAPLGDADIVIAGSSKGFTLATSRAYIDEYVKHTNAVIGPMLKRLERAQKVIKMITVTKHDILSAAEYHPLRQVIRAFNEAQINVSNIHLESQDETPEDIEGIDA